MGLSVHAVLSAAQKAGFELAGLIPAAPVADLDRYAEWVARGYAGRMSYLTDQRADLREDPRALLASARSVLCVGKLYNSAPAGNDSTPSQGWISRYAWGCEDYHKRIRADLETMVSQLRDVEDFAYRICVDTAPLLERSLARQAGLGWIGKNTCLINQRQGSWFFLAEVLWSLDLPVEPQPPPDRCGSCTRCIEACPTAAIVPDGHGGWTLDARLCISYFTIELKGPIAVEHRPAMGNHVFGCDICQDVCPWNRRAAYTDEPGFEAAFRARDLEDLAGLSPHAFREMFGASPVSRTRYSGFLRNVAVAMGNSGNPRFREVLGRILEGSEDDVVREHVRWALARLS